MLRIILIFIVLMHGIGHILFLVPLFIRDSWGQSTQSWLAGSNTIAKIVGSIIWLAAIMAFSLTTFGIISHEAWWRTTAVVASIISLIGLVLFWQNPVSSSVIFAVIVDIAIIIVLVVMHWPSNEVMGT